MARSSGLLGVVVAIAACGPSAPVDNGTYAPVLSEIQSYVFLDRGCAKCHAGAGTEPGLSLLPFDSHTNLVGRGSRSKKWAGTKWEGWKLIEPGNPDRSLLMVVLEQPWGLPEDLAMPADALLSDARIAGIRQWILNGAKDD